MLVEVTARIGRCKPGQVRKVMNDAFKLSTMRPLVAPHAELVLLFGCMDAATCVTGRSWRADAVRAHDIRVAVAEIEEELSPDIREAQDRQRMVKPT